MTQPANVATPPTAFTGFAVHDKVAPDVGCAAIASVTDALDGTVAFVASSIVTTG